jgi:hypothetical protein
LRRANAAIKSAEHSIEVAAREVAGSEPAALQLARRVADLHRELRE